MGRQPANSKLALARVAFQARDAWPDPRRDRAKAAWPMHLPPVLNLSLGVRVGGRLQNHYNWGAKQLAASSMWLAAPGSADERIE